MPVAQNINFTCIYMLLVSWEVHIGKNCDWGLENAALGCRPRAAFSSPRSQFLSFSSCGRLADKRVCLRNFAIESACTPSTNHSQKIWQVNKQVNQTLYEERCIKEQIYFKLLHVSAFSSLDKVPETVFPVWNFVPSLKLYYKNSFHQSLQITRLN